MLTDWQINGLFVALSAGVVLLWNIWRTLHEILVQLKKRPPV